MDQLTERRPSFRRIPSCGQKPGRIIAVAATLVSIVAVGGVAQAATPWSVPLGAGSHGQAQAGTLTAATGVTSSCIGNSGNKVPVVVSWTAAPRATSYTISQATTANGTYTIVATGVTGNSYSFTPSPAGTYFFEVTADLNNWASAPSAPTATGRTTFSNGNCT
jgi:hypothetical protein